MTSISSLKLDEFDSLVQQVKDLATESVRSGTAMHVVEQQLLQKLLELGHAAVKAMFQAVGTGDVGEEVSHPDHKKPLKRFPERSNRVYRSIFGDFELSRYLYGKDPSQKALVIPFDEHFGLPPNRFSLLLESWVSQLSTSEAIHEAMDKLHSILGIRVAVDRVAKGVRSL